MQHQIKDTLQNAKNLNEVKEQFLEFLQEIKKQEKHLQIGYVAGILYSDGPEYFERNRQLLKKRTEIIRKNQNFPIFSAYDIFHWGLYDQIEERNFPDSKRRAAFIQFWRDIVGSSLVTDVFMTPRWEFSEGARDEHETAQKFNLTVHYFNDKN